MRHNYNSFSTLTKEERDVFYDEKVPVGKIIEKEFILSNRKDFSLPPITQIFHEKAFEVERLMREKKRLNATKDKLNEKDIHTWGKHTSFTNQTSNTSLLIDIVGRVVQQLRRDIDPEMCTIAWAKFYEMVTAYPLVQSEEFLNSVHLCEAPGAFICSLNHYLKTKKPPTMRWDWRAITLNPEYEGNNLDAMIDDDRFILESKPHWYFGKDNSGNIMSQANVEGLVAECKKMDGDVLLVTADGSVNSQLEPNEQEALVANLHFCETISAFSILAKGGSFVLKLFTLFEHSSVCLLYLLRCAFETVVVAKPCTSKAGNSEVYVICVGYLPLPTDYLAVLQHHISLQWPEGKSLFPRSSIPPEFLDEVVDCAALFATVQRVVIERNIRLFDRMSWDERKKIEREKVAISHRFIGHFRILPMDPQDRISAQTKLNGSHLNAGRSMGSRSEKEGGNLKERRKRSHSSVTPKEEQGEEEETEERNEKRQKTEEGFDNISEFARNQMKRMGFQEGHGLGAKEDGPTTPIEVVKKLDRGGIGLSAFDPEEENDLFFERLDWLSHKKGWEEVQTTEEWKEEGKEALVSNSRFCNNRILGELFQLRQSVVGSDRSKRNDLCRWEFPCHIFGKGDFEKRGIVKMANLNRWVALLPSALSSFGVANLGAPKYGKYFSSTNGIEVLQCHSPDNSLASYVEQIQKISEKFPEGVPLVVGDGLHFSSKTFTTEIPSKENEVKLTLLSHLFTALQVTQKGGTFICRISDILTRFTVGVFAFLHRSFERVAILKPFSSCRVSGEQFLIGKGFIGCPPMVIDHLRNCIETLHQLHSSNLSLLAILPVDYILERDFWRYVVQTNDRIIAREITALRTLQEHDKEDPEHVASILSKAQSYFKVESQNKQ